MPDRPRLPNRLAKEKSPYLLQHAHNPVDWFPWGDEAFAEAKRRGVPVFLSIGYSTCHWCHVMESESFEDPEIAEFLNRHYVAIKVDREERPDVDSVYMRVVQSLTGHGGWPMSVWLTPDRLPFYGGTYFPPRDGHRGSRFGFLTVLAELARAWREEGEKVSTQAREIARAVREAASSPAGKADLGNPEEIMRSAARHYEGSFDPAHGGWGGAPKFPRSDVHDFLLRAGDSESVCVTLARMAEGGIYDHMGGGFHRYSTDERWFAPHFEKMLYDNAQLAVSYLDGYSATGREDFARVARETLDYLLREMEHPGGGFYSATDADSEGEEGKFFAWTLSELDAALGPGRSRIAQACYRAGDPGNWEGDRNILHTPRPPELVAKEIGLTPAALADEIQVIRRILYEARARRIPPSRDEKILTAWNGLAVSAFARGALVLGEARYLEAAHRTDDFLWKNLRDGQGRLLARWKDGEARFSATLDDYAFWIAGLLDLFETDSRSEWLARAEGSAEAVEAHFADAENGGYYFTADDAEKLLVREKPDHDGAMPSGNSIMAMNLLRLAALTGDGKYRARAEGIFRTFAHILTRYPIALPRMLSALDASLDPPKEIVIVRGREGGGRGGSGDAGAPAFLSVLARVHLPNRILIVTDEENLDSLAARVPLVAGKIAQGGKTTAYVCEQMTCRAPTTDPEVFARQIRD